MYNMHIFDVGKGGLLLGVLYSYCSIAEWFGNSAAVQGGVRTLLFMCREIPSLTPFPPTDKSNV